MSTQNGLTIPPAVEAVLYFLGLMAVYASTYNPTGAPAAVQSAFFLLGNVAIVVKYELSRQPKPQITSHQAVFSLVAYSLTIGGALISKFYGAEWYGGLVVALIGAALASYQDLGGKLPTSTPPVQSSTPAPGVSTSGAAFSPLVYGTSGALNFTTSQSLNTTGMGAVLTNSYSWTSYGTS